MCVSVDDVVVVVVVRPAPASCCCCSEMRARMQGRNFAGHLELTDWRGHPELTDWRSSRVDLLICEPAPLYLDPKSCENPTSYPKSCGVTL